jgi:hypothetical protein
MNSRRGSDVLEFDVIRIRIGRSVCVLRARGRIAVRLRAKSSERTGTADSQEKYEPLRRRTLRATGGKR